MKTWVEEAFVGDIKEIYSCASQSDNRYVLAKVRAAGVMRIVSTRNSNFISRDL